MKDKEKGEKDREKDREGGERECGGAEGGKELEDTGDGGAASGRVG